MTKVFGYARVSTRDQNEERQLVALREIGISDKNIYIDKQSGKNFDRPQYKKLLSKIDGNSVVYIKSIDRLGRNYEEICEQWRVITKERKADIVVLDMPLLDTRKDKNLLGTLISDLVLSLLSYVAESEYQNIHQRQAEGIAAAKARGVKFGRPNKPLPENFRSVLIQWKLGNITQSEAARQLKMPLSSFRSKITWEKQNVR